LPVSTLCQPALCARRSLAESFIVISKFGNYLWAAETCSATFLAIPTALGAYQTGRQCGRYRGQKLHNACGQAAVHAVKVRAGILLAAGGDAQDPRVADWFGKRKQFVG